MKRLFGIGLTMALGASAQTAPAQTAPAQPYPSDPYPAAGTTSSAPPPAASEPLEKPPRPDTLPFQQGAVGLSMLVATAFAGDNEYLILGAGLGFYVANGFQIGIDGAVWVFDSPTIGTVTPKLEYVLSPIPIIKPYLGGFVRHYIVGDGRDDFQTAGGRAGVYIAPGDAAYFGFGALYEHQFDCGRRVIPCDQWYPEITVAVSF
jgi:hypothetical protein